MSFQQVNIGDSPNTGRTKINANDQELFERVDEIEGTIVPFTAQTLTSSGLVNPLAQLVICDTTSGAVTATLHTAVGYAGTTHTIKKLGNNTNTVTILPAGSQTIDGLSSLDTQVYRDSVTVQSDGDEWFIISPPTVYPA
jgi:hypothetical protein